MIDAVDTKINKARYLLLKMSKKGNKYKSRKLKYSEKSFLKNPLRDKEEG